MELVVACLFTALVHGGMSTPGSTVRLHSLTPRLDELNSSIFRVITRVKCFETDVLGLHRPFENDVSGLPSFSTRNVGVKPPYVE